MVTPIGIPDDWDDNNLILFEEFCELIRTPQRTVRDWRRRGVGPRWTRFQGVGRLSGSFRWLSAAPSRST
jgi:hypothetical protein